MSGVTSIRDIVSIGGAPRRRMMMAAMCSIAGAAVSLAIPWLAGSAVANLEDADLLVSSLALITGLLALRLVFEVLKRLLTGKARFEVIRDLREQWFARALSIPPGSEGDDPRQDWISILSYDAPRVAEFAVDTPVGLIASALTLVGAGVLMWLLAPALSIAVLLLAPLAYVGARFAAQRLRQRAAKFWNLEVEVMSQADDAFRARWVVQAFDQEQRLRREFGATAQSAEGAAVSHVQLTAMIGPLTQFVSFVGMVGIVAVAMRLELTLGPGELLTFVLYGLLLTQPLRSFADGLGLWHEVNGTLQRFDNVSRAAAEAPDSGSRTDAPAQGTLRFNQMSFGWRDPLFDDANLVIAPGEHIALVGPNGAGKTTLISLMLGLIEPTAGTIELDGVDLAELDASTRRRLFAVVPQQPMLIGRTVRDCVSFGRPDATFPEVRAALDAALALEFVEQLPNGVETPIGEDGVRLSGGERQRLAVARALLLDTPVVVFDEPTASYDEVSTHRFVEQAESLLAGRTVFWITHEQAPLSHVDRVVRLHDRRFRAFSEVGPGTGLGSGIAP